MYIVAVLVPYSRCKYMFRFGERVHIKDLVIEGAYRTFEEALVHAKKLCASKSPVLILWSRKNTPRYPRIRAVICK